jgi:FkbM family methyltransferase
MLLAYSEVCDPKMDPRSIMKEIAKRLLGMAGYRLHGTSHIPRVLLDAANLRQLTFADAIARQMIDHGHELTFIQIGAFDGITADPLYPYISRFGWRGVLVEPQSGPAGKLRQLYASNDRVTVVQAAIGHTHGKQSLFTVVSDSAPAWAGGMASFDRRSIEKHAALVPGLPDMIKEELVDCVPFDHVLKQMHGEHLDLLQIDAEGADALILSMFPFQSVKPAIIHFEIKNLATSTRQECLERLQKCGYRFAPSGDEDMLAMLG